MAYCPGVENVEGERKYEATGVKYHEIHEKMEHDGTIWVFNEIMTHPSNPEASRN
jgi:hypothetical protein